MSMRSKSKGREDASKLTKAEYPSESEIYHYVPIDSSIRSKYKRRDDASKREDASKITEPENRPESEIYHYVPIDSSIRSKYKRRDDASKREDASKITEPENRPESEIYHYVPIDSSIRSKYKRRDDASKREDASKITEPENRPESEIYHYVPIDSSIRSKYKRRDDASKREDASKITEPENRPESEIYHYVPIDSSIRSKYKRRDDALKREDASKITEPENRPESEIYHYVPIDSSIRSKYKRRDDASKREDASKITEPENRPESEIYHYVPIDSSIRSKYKRRDDASKREDASKITEPENRPESEIYHYVPIDSSIRSKYKRRDDASKREDASKITEPENRPESEIYHYVPIDSTIRSKTKRREDASKVADPEYPLESEIYHYVPIEMSSKSKAREYTADDHLDAYLAQGRVMVLDESNILRRVNRRGEVLRYVPESKDAVRNNPGAIKALDCLQTTDIDTLQHYFNLGEYMAFLRNSNGIHDVKIHVDNDVFPAHRVALSYFSSYFSDIFSKMPRQCKTWVSITMHNVSSDVFQVFLNFVYNREINVNYDNLIEVLNMADSLGIQVLKDVCLELLNDMPLGKVVKILNAIKHSTNRRLLGFVMARISKDFSQLYNCVEFLELGVKTVCQILSCEDLRVSTEMEVFKTAMEWISHSMNERRRHVYKVMTCVKYQGMTRQELFKCMEIADMLKDFSAVIDIILRANWTITAEILGITDPLKLPVHTGRRCFAENSNLKSRRKVPEGFLEDMSK